MNLGEFIQLLEEINSYRDTYDIVFDHGRQCEHALAQLDGSEHVEVDAARQRVIIHLDCA